MVNLWRLQTVVEAHSRSEVMKAGNEKRKVPGVSLSPAHVFQLRNNSSEEEGNGQMDPGDSLILTQLHCHQDSCLC